jgi:hypothetical protein
MLSRVTSDPTQPNQTTKGSGSFNSWGVELGGDGASHLPLTDSQGNAAMMHFTGGQETLRFTTFGGPGSANYLHFTPVPNQAPKVQELQLEFSEDGGGAVLNVDAGPSWEAWQGLNLSVTTDRPGLHFNLEGDKVVVQTDPNVNGEWQVTATVQDDGALNFGGSDTTRHSFSLKIVAVNDAPTLPRPDTIVLPHVAQPTTWPIQVEGVGRGNGSDEGSQTLSGETAPINVDNPLISIPTGPLTLGPGNTATFTMTQKPNRFGTATGLIRLTDSGGTENGGRDQTETSFVVKVLPPADWTPLIVDVAETGGDNESTDTIPAKRTVMVQRECLFCG